MISTYSCKPMNTCSFSPLSFWGFDHTKSPCLEKAEVSLFPLRSSRRSAPVYGQTAWTVTFLKKLCPSPWKQTAPPLMSNTCGPVFVWVTGSGLFEADALSISAGKEIPLFKIKVSDLKSLLIWPAAFTASTKASNNFFFLGGAGSLNHF